MSSAAPARRLAVGAVALVASCSPFSGSIDDEAGNGAGADASTSDETGASDGQAPDSAIGSMADGGVTFPAGSFCATFTDALQCFDFDEAALSGLVVGKLNGGQVAVASNFDGGSPPLALVATTTNMGAKAVATAPTIILSQHKNATLTVDFQFYVAAQATAIEYIARLNFNTQTSPIAFNNANGLQCGGTTFANLAVGAHAVSISMAIDNAGVVSAFSCSLDGSVPYLATVAVGTTLSVELGNANAGGAAMFATSYDNVVVRVH